MEVHSYSWRHSLSTDVVEIPPNSQKRRRCFLGEINETDDDEDGNCVWRYSGISWNELMVVRDEEILRCSLPPPQDNKNTVAKHTGGVKGAKWNQCNAKVCVRPSCASRRNSRSTSAQKFLISTRLVCFFPVMKRRRNRERRTVFHWCFVGKVLSASIF